jgi:hypothetical protein
MAFEASTWTDTRTAEETPKRWRNWWRALTHATARCYTCGVEKEMEAGELFASHCVTHHTKEDAIKAASVPQLKRVHVGAYPDGERPQ